jgi:hypothetical protein
MALRPIWPLLVIDVSLADIRTSGCIGFESTTVKAKKLKLYGARQ